jgi:hypothetical protein
MRLLTLCSVVKTPAPDLGWTADADSQETDVGRCPRAGQHAGPTGVQRVDLMNYPDEDLDPYAVFEANLERVGVWYAKPL